MAAITPAESLATLDFTDLLKFAREQLPGYAVPLFLRVKVKMETTGTFKYKKADLKQAGYDPRQVDGPLFVRLPSSTSFEPLDDELHAAIARQVYRF